jgi:ABC-type transporter Mla maintaining outer membrane lipid asymmetry ATPase subunit MlaF
MKTVIHFQNVEKNLRGNAVLQIQDLRILERESVGIYGLSAEQMEIILNQITGAYETEQGSVQILGTDSRELDEESWFHFIEKLGIYTMQPVFQEGSSVGENVARLYRLQNDLMEEPQLSASVLNLANLVQLTITDLSKMMSEAGASLRMKVRLSKAFAYHPRIVVMCDPSLECPHEVTREMVELVRRARRKLRFTLVLFTSDLWLLEHLADRVIFLNPADGFSVENQLRGWYHKFFPFLNPSPGRLMQLSLDALQHAMKVTEEKMEKR